MALVCLIVYSIAWELLVLDIVYGSILVRIDWVDSNLTNPRLSD